LLVAPVGKEEVMIKTVATVPVASVIAIAAWAGGVVGATAAILQGGSAEDTALRDAALFHNIEDVKDALKKGANANAPSAQRRHTTPLGAVAMGGHGAKAEIAPQTSPRTRPLANSLSGD
jgi:hypothetical protein